MSEPIPLTAEEERTLRAIADGAPFQVAPASPGGQRAITMKNVFATLDAARTALAAAERTAEVRLTVTNATLARERELLGRIAAAVALAEARGVALAAIVEYPTAFDMTGNAVGHAHAKPGIWDQDGKPCGWCAAFFAARAALALTDAGALEALRERVRAEIEAEHDAETRPERVDRFAKEAEALYHKPRSYRRLAQWAARIENVARLRALAGGRKGDGNE